MKTRRIANTARQFKVRRIIQLIAALAAGGLASRSFAEDWGVYSIVPVSAQAMVLEAVDSGTTDGTVVSINKPASTANQKWVIVPKEGNLFSIKPSYSSTLVLAADQEMDKALKFSGYDYQFRIIDGRHVAGYAEHWQEAMAYLWRGWPERVKAGPSAPRAQEILIPGESWQLVAEGFKSTRGPACNANGEVFFADTSANKILRIDLDGKVSEFVADAGSAHGLSFGPDGKLYAVSEKTGKVMSYDANGAGSVMLEGLAGQSIVAMPNGGLYVTSNSDKANAAGSVWFVKDGKKTQVEAGLKFATGVAYRPDQWLLSVADGHSKWVYSYQIKDDGSLANKERFFALHVEDWDDDAGAESICYSLEGRQFIATRSGVQISADDGPTQVILPIPDRSRVIGVCLGGRDQDTLFAFCGNKIWKRKVQHHAMGAFTPWTKVGGTKL